MNCIFCCVFHQEQYVEMFYLFLESLFTFGNLDENTMILVYTSTPFMNLIKQNKLFKDEKIKFEINDTYNDVEKSCFSRLDMFNLPSITTYEKILYLDTDILVKDDINIVFNLCKKNILYVLEEGSIDYYPGDYWGYSLFGDEVNNYSDKSGFTTGIMLFNNCEEIKQLFRLINEDILKRPLYFSCYDQPYIIYSAFKYNLYDNKILKSYAINRDYNIHSDKVIHHFSGGPGVYQHKIDEMTTFLNGLKGHSIKIFDSRKEMIKHYSETIAYPIILELGVFKGVFLDYLVKNCNHRCIDAVDLFEGVTCSGDDDGNNVEYYDVGTSHLELVDKYKNMPNVTIIKSNSVSFLQNQPDDSYDIIYIDADHSYEGVKNDLVNSYRKIKNLGYIMGHDYEMNMVKARNIYDFGTKKAVEEFCLDFKQIIMAKAMDGCVSFCIQVQKN